MAIPWEVPIQMSNAPEQVWGFVLRQCTSRSVALLTVRPDERNTLVATQWTGWLGSQYVRMKGAHLGCLYAFFQAFGGKKLTQTMNFLADGTLRRKTQDGVPVWYWADPDLPGLLAKASALPESRPTDAVILRDVAGPDKQPLERKMLRFTNVFDEQGVPVQKLTHVKAELINKVLTTHPLEPVVTLKHALLPALRIWQSWLGCPDAHVERPLPDEIVGRIAGKALLEGL